MKKTNILLLTFLFIFCSTFSQEINYASFGIDISGGHVPVGFYQDSLSLITDQGFTLVAITPETIEKVEQTVKLHNLTYPVIYDCQEKIMLDYGLIFDVTKDFQDLVLDRLKINIAEHNGREVAHLPVAATYIINRNGIITARYFEPDYHKRASVNWILAKMATGL